jgi:hypothetical protein
MAARGICAKAQRSRKVLYDHRKGCLSAKRAQICGPANMDGSGASADAQVLDTVAKWDNAIGNTTPIYTIIVQALLDIGHREQALNAIREYWAGWQKQRRYIWELFAPMHQASLTVAHCEQLLPRMELCPHYFLRRYFSNGNCKAANHQFGEVESSWHLQQSNGRL